MLKHLFTIAAMICLSGLSIGQTYHFSTSTEPYTDLTGGTNLVNSPWDDPVFAVPLPFTFEFYDKTLTELYQVADFSSISLVNEEFNDTLSFITPYGIDLVDRGIGTGTSQSPITYKTVGPIGERILTIEWQNAGFYGQYFDNGSTSDFVNLQVKLFEKSGDIEFHYGPSSITVPDLDFPNGGPFVGIFEAIKLPDDVAIGEVVLLSGNPANPNVEDSYDAFFLSGTPPPNTVYRFSREVVGTHDPIVAAKSFYYGPNPTTNIIALNPEREAEILAPVYVYNAYGALVMQDDEPSSIDISNLIPGIYNLQFSTVVGKVSQRIAVVR